MATCHWSNTYSHRLFENICIIHATRGIIIWRQSILRIYGTGIYLPHISNITLYNRLFYVYRNTMCGKTLCIIFSASIHIRTVHFLKMSIASLLLVRAGYGAAVSCFKICMHVQKNIEIHVKTWNSVYALYVYLCLNMYTYTEMYIFTWVVHLYLPMHKMVYVVLLLCVVYKIHSMHQSIQ